MPKHNTVIPQFDDSAPSFRSKKIKPTILTKRRFQPAERPSVLTDEQFFNVQKITCQKTLVDVLKEHLRVPLLPRALFSFDTTYREVMQIHPSYSFISHPAFVEKSSEPALASLVRFLPTTR
jgi:hypothetical protein